MRTILIFMLMSALLLGGCAREGGAIPDAASPPPDAVGTDQPGRTLIPTSAVPPLDNPAEPGLKLSLSAQEYALTDTEIAYTVENTVGEEAYVQFIPRLERRVGDDWEAVKCNALFCGTPDPVRETWEGTVPLEWFDDLEAGEYRINFTRMDTELHELGILSAEFSLK